MDTSGKNVPWKAAAFTGYLSRPCLSLRACSSLRVTRVSNGEVLLVGNMQSQDFLAPVQRYYFMTLPASETYRIEVVASSRNPSFAPVRFTAQYADSGACGKGLTLLFKQSTQSAWIVPQTLYKDYQRCSGTSSVASSDKAIFQQTCINSKPWLEVYLSHAFTHQIVLKQGSDSIGCPATQ